MSYGMSSTGMNPSTTASGKPMKEKIPSGYKKYSMQNFDPNQMELFQQMFAHLGPDSFLSKLAGGDQATFDEIERPALQQFAGLQSSIANKYSGGGPGKMGNQMGLGARRSSGFQNEQTSAAGQFAQQLQAQRSGLQSQALKDLMAFSNQLLSQEPYDNFIHKKQPSPWGAIAGKAFGPVGGFISDLVTKDKQWTGTQTGVDTSYDIAKSFAGMAGKAAGGGGY